MRRGQRSVLALLLSLAVAACGNGHLGARDDAGARVDDGAVGPDVGTGKTDDATMPTDPPPPPPPCVPVPGSAGPTGSLDAATDVVAAGWAADPDWAGPVNVHLYVDDHLVDIFAADRPRGDLTGNHAFHQPHESFGYGTHTVKAFAIGVDAQGCPDGNNVLVGGPTAVAGDCNNVPELFRGWCTAVPHYWRDKFVDTQRLVGSNLILGVNTSFGGTIMELYGRDRGWNLVNEQGGAAIQLSLWGYGANNEQRGVTLPGKGAPCAGALGPSDDPFQWPYNPIQAQQGDCSWAVDTDASNDVDGMSFENGVLTVQLNDPINYTGSLPMPGMQFRQEASIVADAYVKLQYRAANFSTVTINDPHPQESPAIFLNLGVNPTLYFYDGDAGWTNAAVTTLPLTDKEASLSFLGRDITPANGPQAGRMSEGWYSICSQDGIHCVTIATPLDPASDIWEGIAGPNPASGNVYATLMAYYPLSSGTIHDTTVYLFPFRYDEVVSGKTVRSWICSIMGHDC